jgi:adenylate kinase family enzyme
MDSTIILIGPMSAGKSTIGGLLAEKLGWPRYSLDEKRWEYYQEIGYDEAFADNIRQAEGMEGLLRYWKPFEAHAVVRILSDHSSGVIDFGAGHSVYEDDALFNRVQDALAAYPFVILLLPSPDLDESVEILNNRFVQMLAEEEGIEADSRTLQINEHFVKHPSNQLLAKKIVYTNGKTPDETCAEILQHIAKEGAGFG